MLVVKDYKKIPIIHFLQSFCIPNFSLRTRSHFRKDNHRLSSESQKAVISTPDINIQYQQIYYKNLKDIQYQKKYYYKNLKDIQYQKVYYKNLKDIQYQKVYYKSLKDIQYQKKYYYKNLKVIQYQKVYYKNLKDIQYQKSYNKYSNNNNNQYLALKKE
ncbi:hypothetical protein H8356DRAFT_1323596 [Neocallimastix lanati (nom. inval.)]|nr:hypothetical protein H8356DRAFT_1323596 [Neocallimastix sp. JGI-2020a]